MRRPGRASTRTSAPRRPGCRFPGWPGPGPAPGRAGVVHAHTSERHLGRAGSATGQRPGLQPGAGPRCGRWCRDAAVVVVSAIVRTDPSWPSDRRRPGRSQRDRGRAASTAWGPSRCSSARRPAWARPTRCCSGRASCSARARTWWWASSRPTVAARPGAAAGLEVLPPRRIDYRGRTLQEMDLDALLGAPRRSRWWTSWHTRTRPTAATQAMEDVEELLAAGIDVWTTMNVQHLESLNDWWRRSPVCASPKSSPTRCSTWATSSWSTCRRDELIERLNTARSTCRNRPRRRCEALLLARQPDGAARAGAAAVAEHVDADCASRMRPAGRQALALRRECWWPSTAWTVGIAVRTRRRWPSGAKRAMDGVTWTGGAQPPPEPGAEQDRLADRLRAGAPAGR